MSRFSLLLSTFIIAAAGSAFAAKKLVDKSVAIVNDEVILSSDVNRFQEKIRSKGYQELFGQVDPRALNNRDVALQVLIEEKIINQQVKKLELTVNDQELEGRMKAIQRRNNISPDQLTQRLKQLGTSMTEYREGIRRQIERHNLVEREIKPNLEISEEQLRHFYLRNFKPSPTDKQYKIAHILFDAKRPGSNAEGRANQVYEELKKNPGNFEKTAKEVSDDTETAQNGGILGFFKSEQLAKEFRASVPKIKVGEITEPIKTGSGYHIVKLLEISSVDFNSLSREQKEMLRNQLGAEELERRMGMWLERKKADSYIRVSKD